MEKTTEVGAVQLDDDTSQNKGWKGQERTFLVFERPERPERRESRDVIDKHGCRPVLDSHLPVGLVQRRKQAAWWEWNKGRGKQRGSCGASAGPLRLARVVALLD